MRAKRSLPSNLIVLKPAQEEVICQRDLEELILLAREAREARQLYEEKRKAIYGAINAGCKTEPGVHTAVLRARLSVR